MHGVAASRRFISNLVHFQNCTPIPLNTNYSKVPQTLTPLLWKFQKQFNGRDKRGLTTSISSHNSDQSGTRSLTTDHGSTACPTTIKRPRLSPLPYIFLRDLPYVRSTDLQERLVERQIRLRKTRETRNTQETNKDNSGASINGGSLECDNNDILLIVEHTPTYTNGRRNRGANSVKKDEVVRLEGLGATYVESLRGGEITYHGPGQLVAYPILDLKPIELSVRCYVSYLEKAIIATCAEMNIKAITTENTGVWINDQKKIAAIGNECKLV
ncbi:hypothetical protein BGZ76_010316 [Entomortierella beljakovae]|nr:hypothetical protein BGZ76_010316 [Entomortierella beljakovae]